MTKPSQSGFKRFFYNQNIKRDKSGKKYKNLIDHTIILTKRIEKEGVTTWLLNAVNKASKKIEAYGIALHQFETALQHKKLDHLIALFHQTFANKIKTISTKTTQASTPAPQKASVKKITKEETSTEKKKTPAKKVYDAETTKAPKRKITTKKVAPKKEAKANTEKKTTAKKTTSKTTKKSA